MYTILIYDINTNDEGSNVLNKVFKTCKKYLVHIQNSVFEGNISEVQYLKLKNELQQILRKDKDSCIMFCSRNEKWLKKEFLVPEEEKVKNFF